MSEKPLLHKPIMEKTAEEAQKRCSDTAEADPKFTLVDSPWGKSPMFTGDVKDLMHYRTPGGIASGFPFRREDKSTG